MAKKEIKKPAAKKPAKKTEKAKGMQGFILAVEKVGNKLPHPVFLFIYLGLIFMFFSIIGSALGWSNPLDATGGDVKSLFSLEGIYYMFNNFINNFAKYGGNSIFGTILLLTMAVGVGTSTGYWQALIKKMTQGIPANAVSYVVVGIGAFTSIASDAGYVVFVPLAAIIFNGYGRHPIAGIAAAFSGVSAGFSATLLPGASDAIFAEVWASFAGDAHVAYEGVFTATATWFFQAVSLIMMAFVGGYVTDKFVEPAIKHIDTKDDGGADKKVTEFTKAEKKGLKYANITLGVILLLFIIGSWPGFGPLSFGQSFNGETPILGSNGRPDLSQADWLKVSNIGAWTKDSIFMKAISLNLGIIFFAAGVAYGWGAGTIKKKEDIIEHEKNALKGIGAYITISIVALNVINWFNWTGLGGAMAGHIGQWLQTSGLGDHGMLIILPSVLIITMLMNLVISGLSSKGYILGPVFLALTAALDIGVDGDSYDIIAIGMMYRIADSVTNIITPIMSYFIIILAFAQNWCKNEDDFGAGNLIAVMMPYSIFYLLFWIVLFVIWYVLGIPFGI